MQDFNSLFRFCCALGLTKILQTNTVVIFGKNVIVACWLCKFTGQTCKIQILLNPQKSPSVIYYLAIIMCYGVKYSIEISQKPVIVSSVCRYHMVAGSHEESRETNVSVHVALGHLRNTLLTCVCTVMSRCVR